MKKVILRSIVLYQATASKLWAITGLSHGCRFYPSCSEYCIQAVNKYGAMRGLIKGFLRVLKCNPLNRGGIDLC